MSAKDNITILIAPLDWGLGHATRCIPLIHHFIKLQCNIIIAADEKQENLLKTEFPTLRFVHLPGYRIQYTISKRLFHLKIICQIPKIIKAIKTENKWLSDFVESNGVDVVISDNRYGLYNQTLHTVFLTHQLTIKTGNFFTELILQKINYSFIRHFSECWIPDEGNNISNLGGKLSHPQKMPHIPVKYLGALSRFENQKSSISYKLLIILSGPEPQRSRLENLLIEQLKEFNHEVIFVRGLPGEKVCLKNTALITFFNHLPAKGLEKYIRTAEYIISRSGYTTIMDLCKLRKKSILIPTPGQTEQEYLAFDLQMKGFCIAINQTEFRLLEALAKANIFNYKFPDFSMNNYKAILDSLVQQIIGERL